MVNEVILKYLRDNKANYPLAALKRELVSKGHSVQSVVNAIALLERPSVIKEDSAMKPFVGRKWFLFSSILGFVFFFLGLLAIGLSVSRKVLETPAEFLLLPLAFILIFGCFYYYGFVGLSKRANSKFLRVTSILNIIITVVSFVFYIWIGFFGDINEYFNISAVASGRVSLWVYVFLFVLFLFLSMIRLLFSVGLVKIRKRFEFAGIAGGLGLSYSTILIIATCFFGYLILDRKNLVKFILNLYFNASSRLILGWIVRCAAFIFSIGVFFESMVLFKESKKK